MCLVNSAELILDASGYQKVKKSDAKLGIRGLGLQHFNIQGTIVTETTSAWAAAARLPERPWIKRKYVKWSRILAGFVEARKPLNLRRVVRERESRHFTFDRQVYNRTVKAMVSFEGYWQTEKYFAEIEPIIRSELTVREPLDEKNTRLATEIRSCNSVAIHVRHGDNASGVETGMGVLPRSFYEQAMSLLKGHVQNPQFFVFSEDMDWAKSMLRLGNAATYVSHNDDAHNYEDLRLMSLCRHHIVANSTFSWWGAWLGKKEGQIVYAPRRYWQNVDRPNPDLYPPEWRLL